MAAALLIHCEIVEAQSGGSELVFIGTYTSAKSQGIYLTHLDPASGRLGPLELAAKTENPTFLALHPNRRFLYAANEIDNFGGQRSGAVSGFRIDPQSGKLTLLGQQPSGGGGPCHLAVDGAGRCVLVANYGSGSLAVLGLGDDGRLDPPSSVLQHHGSSVNPQRQAGPHAHFITTDPANRFALACDLGLDKVFIYRLNIPAADGTPGLTTNDPPWLQVKPGSGPRHLAFHPNGRFVYLISELGCTLTACSYDAKRGALDKVQVVSTLPEGFKGDNISAEVQVHPSGRFVYGSNRGDDSIVVFAIDPNSGKLSFIQRVSTQGKTPRHFAFDTTGQWLLCEDQDSDRVVEFAVDAATGRLTPTGQTLQVGAPVCAVFLSE